MSLPIGEKKDDWLLPISFSSILPVIMVFLTYEFPNITVNPLGEETQIASRLAVSEHFQILAGVDVPGVGELFLSRNEHAEWDGLLAWLQSPFINANVCYLPPVSCCSLHPWLFFTSKQRQLHHSPL